MDLEVTFLGTGASAPSARRSTAAVMIARGGERLLFDCGEGTQRLFVENGIRANKITYVFLTRMNWECLGGVPGMILTLADAGVRNLNFHGGPNLTHFMAANRHFVAR